MRFPEFSGEWESVILKDIADFQKERISSELLDERTYISTENILQNFEGVQSANSIPANTNVIEYKESDILLSNIRPYLKKVWFADRTGGCSADVFVLRSRSCEPKYLYYVIASDKFINYIMSGAKGVKMPRGDKKQMECFTFSIPAIAEQKKISRLLHLLDERITTQNKIIERYESLIRGINQYAFTNTGINYKLGEICEIRSGYSGNQLTLKNGLKVSRIETISGHKVNMERVGYVAPFESSENYRLQIGDILFSNINSVEYIGNTAFIDKDYNLYHGMNLLRLIPKKELVMPFYLYLVLNTNRLLNHFKTVCNKAVSQASINQTELGKTIVRIPNLMNQNRICELFQTLYTKLEAERYFISLLQDQKQHLLRQMFI